MGITENVKIEVACACKQSLDKAWFIKKRPSSKPGYNTLKCRNRYIINSSLIPLLIHVESHKK